MGKNTSMGRFFFGCFGSAPRRRSQTGQSPKNDDSLHHDGAIDVSLSKTGDHDGDESCCSESVKRFSWRKIEEMTTSFSEAIGLGGYSTVYLARLPDSSMGAVKVYNSSERLNQVFRSEVEITSQLSHPSIVRLLGYCDERDEGVLVFEYIPHGTLQDKLHNKIIPQVLPWKTRMAIAYQLAQALDHLHDQCSPHIVHGDIKASNILLLDPNHHDPEAKTYCKLCDFGFAKMGFSWTIKPHSSSSSSSRLAMMGSPGYIDPHYLMTGIASKKSDVYSFGVLLLELITGLEAFPSERRELLTSMVRKSNGDFDMEKVVGMVDPRLGGGFDMAEARTMARVSAMCLHHLPSLRPSAAEICQAMRENVSSISLLCESKKL